MNSEVRGAWRERRELIQDINTLSSRDLQLWSITIIVMLVLAGGVISVVIPNASTTQRSMNLKYVPQLALGLVALVVLLNVYLIEQRRTLNRTRQVLMRRIAEDEVLDEYTPIDPVTQTFTRKFLDYLLPREVHRANNEGAPLTFCMIVLESYERTAVRHGFEAAQQVLAAVGKILKSNFRGSDVVVRYDEPRFLVVLTDTDASQSEPALRRLRVRFEAWNTVRAPYEIAWSFHTAQYRNAEDVEHVITELAKLAVRPSPSEILADKPLRAAVATPTV